MIVPTDALPPATPFTFQVTFEFEVPVTVALNVCVAPARTVAGFGVTLTLMLGGGGGAPGFPGFVVTPATPAQSA